MTFLRPAPAVSCFESMVRRLKVLNTPQGDDAEAAERSVPAWIAIGGALTLALFLPLSALGLWLGARLAPGFGSAAGALPLLAAFAVSAWGGGAIAGRFGARLVARHGLLAGALGGLLTLLPAVLARALSPWSVALAAAVFLVAAGAGFAWLGARYGIRQRPRLD
jgi:hypothetical protein